MEEREIEIIDSNLKDYKVYKIMTLTFILIYNIVVPVFTFVVSPIIQEGAKCEGGCLSMFVLSIIAGNVFFLAMLYNYRITFIPTKYVKFIFTNEKFEVFLQKRLYFRQFSNELNEIRIVKKKNYPVYDLIFNGIKKKTIRLTRIIIHEKKRNEVLENIKKWGENLKIPVTQQIIKNFYTKEYERDKKAIQNWFKIKAQSNSFSAKENI